MKKIINSLCLIGFSLLWPVVTLAQTAEVPIKENVEVDLFGLPGGWVLWVFVLIIGVVWGYYQKNKSKVTKIALDYINTHVNNELLKETLKTVTSSAISAAEVTYRDLYKPLKEASEDKVLTQEEKDELIIYAKAKMKSFIPTVMKGVLKNEGLDHDSFYKGEIEKAVGMLKAANKPKSTTIIKKILSTKKTKGNVNK